jgi:hypothetical protein
VTLPVSPLAEVRRRAWVLVLIAAIASGIGAAQNLTQFFHSYLFAFLLVFGLSSGALGFSLLYLLVGGAWGRTGRSVLRSASLVMPWLGLLFIPILVGLAHIYPWMGDAFWHHGPVLDHKRIYFNLPFFIGRAIVFFALWSWLAYRASKITDEQVDANDPRAHALGSIGLLVYVLTLSVASFDWIISLEPHWASSIFGALVLVGHGVGALAFTVVMITWLSRRYGTVYLPTKQTAHDFGNLMLAFCMLWTYMTLSQYLIIWSGNLPEEISWYISRSHGGWRVLTTILILCQFFIPFGLLLARERKRDLSRLVKVAIYLMVVRVLDLYYMVQPEFSPKAFQIHWLDFSVLIALAAVWFALMSRRLEAEVRS